MKTPKTTLFPALALLLSSAAAADDYAALLHDASNGLDDAYLDSWAFTETSVESDLATVARYDPRRPAGERWTLESVNDRVPTEEEEADFLDDKADEERDDSDDGDDGNDGVDAMVQPDSLELVEESAEGWLFRFAPSPEEMDESFLEHVDGTLRIARAGPYLEEFEMVSRKPFRPKFGVKVSEFRTRLTFGPAAGHGPVVPQSLDVQIKLRAYLAISVNETMTVRYSDYEYVGD